MEKAKIIALKESVLEDNDKDAQALREELHAGGTCLMNLMSSPGSGKTTTLLALNMANIRRKIEKNPAEPQYIFTEVGVGYRMIEGD